MRLIEATDLEGCRQCDMDLRHILFPSICPSCDLVTHEGFCRLCREDVGPWEGSACQRCQSDDATRCLCATLPAEVQWVRSLWTFRGPVIDAVELAKYEGDLWRLRALEPLVLPWARSTAAGLPRGTEVVPVAAARERLQKRGFDWPALVAARLARALGYQLRLDLLHRLGAHQQARLSRSARQVAAARAFYTRGIAKGAVLLVDDVLTTGATVTSAATELVRAGASAVAILTVARTPSFVLEDGY